jgi:Peptidase A4 family
MRMALVRSGALALGVTLAALTLSGLTSTGVASATSRQGTPAQALAAHRAFVKYLSSHATMIRATGSAKTLQTSGNVSEVGSFNWSGMADVQTGTTPISAVSGRWTIPEVDCLNGAYQNQDLFLSNWVGLDGFSDGTVEQLGTATQCYEGVEYYYDWYEMFPNGTVEEGTTQCINNNTHCPKPGDEIQASVVSTPDGAGNNDYTLALTDSTRPAESFSFTASCPDTTCLNSSAEWIVERPAFDLPFGFQILPQADYGKTSFTNGTVTAGGTTTSIENYSDSVYDLAMIDDSQGYILSCPGQTGPPGQLLLLSSATTCPLDTPVHGSFRDTWDSSF